MDNAGINPRPARRIPIWLGGYAARWAALGATHLTVDTMGAGLAQVTGHVAALPEKINTLRADGT